mmetsp:Transcript_18371/g.32905  ORF Transcript_18371/g.32905 Transcript_18371/m.32905 type:complete len:261 (+) Transcript_18371:586-1368(+)
MPLPKIRSSNVPPLPRLLSERPGQPWAHSPCPRLSPPQLRSADDSTPAHTRRGQEHRRQAHADGQHRPPLGDFAEPLSGHRQVDLRAAGRGRLSHCKKQKGPHPIGSGGGDEDRCGLHPEELHQPQASVDAGLHPPVHHRCGSVHAPLRPRVVPRVDSDHGDVLRGHVAHALRRHDAAPWRQALHVAVPVRIGICADFLHLRQLPQLPGPDGLRARSEAHRGRGAYRLYHLHVFQVGNDGPRLHGAHHGHRRHILRACQG